MKSFLLNKRSFVTLIIIVGFCGISYLITDFLVYRGICLDFVNTIIMMATLLAAIFFGVIQCLQRPEIKVEAEDVTNNGAKYIVVANMGNRIAKTIEIRGNVADINKIAFLAPNEKFFVKISKKDSLEYNCIDLEQFEENGQPAIKEGLPHRPNIGFSKKNNCLYICNNKSYNEFALNDKTINWLHIEQ